MIGASDRNTEQLARSYTWMQTQAGTKAKTKAEPSLLRRGDARSGPREVSTEPASADTV